MVVTQHPLFDQQSKKQLNVKDQQLVLEAIDAMRNSHSPYSEFRVGAALRLEDGTVLKGSNQENAAYPAGLCAERTTLYSYGITDAESPIDTLVVLARKNNGEEFATSSPCGGCRQVMLEFQARQSKPFRVIFWHTDKFIIVDGIKELLPYAFTPDDLD